VSIQSEHPKSFELSNNEVQENTPFTPESALNPVDVSALDQEQYRAFDVICQHLDLTLSGHSPQPLRMIMYGAGGTGKSRVIQTVTKMFRERGVSLLLIKAAYTGIAASLIKGKMTHYIGQISFQEMEKTSKETRKKLEEIWKHATYLIIDGYSTISKVFLARLSRSISKGVHGPDTDINHSFGGISVILCGDLHQFPPVAMKIEDALFHFIQAFDSPESKLG